MPSFVTVTSGATAQAQDVNQLINAMNGTAGQGIPISLTALNDSVNFALAVKNADPTNSRSLQVLRSNNNVLLQADANGVIVSPDGGATTAQVVNTTLAQTLTNKTLTSPSLTGATLTSPTITSPTLSGGVFGAWTTFTPTVAQGASAPTLTVTYASYVILGKIVIVSFAVTLTSAGAAGSAIQLSLPAAVSARSVGLNGARAVFTYHTATTYYTGSGWLVNAGNDMQFTVSGQTGQLGATPNFAVANGDTLSATGVWELL